MTENEEFEFRARAEAEARQQPPTTPFKVGDVGATARQMGKESGFLGRLATGASMGATNIAHSLGLGGKNEKQDREILRAATEDAGVAGTIGQLGVEIGATFLPALKAAQLASKAVQIAKYAPKILKQAAASAPGMAAVEGAVSGAMVTPEDRTGAALTGAALGPAFQKTGNWVGQKFAKPIAQTPEAELLRKQGIPITAGQGADRDTMIGSLYGGAENFLSHVPGVGAPLANTRDKAMSAWRTGAMNKATPQAVDPKLTPIRQMEENIKPSLDTAYRNILANKNVGQRDPDLNSNLANIVTDPKLNLTDKGRTRIGQYIQENLLDDYNPQLPLEQLFEKQTIMRTAARRSKDPEVKVALNKAADEVYASIGRSLGDPDKGAALMKLKPLMAKQRVLANTLAKTKGRGEFTPTQLRSTAARVHPELADYSRAAEEVFDTTTGKQKMMRTIAGLGVGGGALLGAHYSDNPLVAGLPIGASILMSRKGLNKVLSGSTKTQEALARMLKKDPALSGTLAGQVGSAFNGEEEE